MSRDTSSNPENDPMFGAIVRGAQANHERQQQEALRDAGRDPRTGQQSGGSR